MNSKRSDFLLEMGVVGLGVGVVQLLDTQIVRQIDNLDNTIKNKSAEIKNNILLYKSQKILICSLMEKQFYMNI